MNSNDIMATICFFLLLGWIPILSIGKAIAMIVESIKGNSYYSNRDDDNTGFQLIESWRIPCVSLEQVYDKQENLNNQGWFTVIHNPDENNPNEFEIIVYGKNEE